MKRRTLAGNCGVAVFTIAFVCILVAFTTPSWLVSDYRITGAKLDRLGLWVHCFRSLPDVNDDYQRRFFVGCRWVYDPFTTGYDDIRGFLIPCEDLTSRNEWEHFNYFCALHFGRVHDIHTILLHAVIHLDFHFLGSGAVVLLMRRARSKAFPANDKGLYSY